MKKLFTLCACACLAFTLSAQDSEHAAGSWYLGAGDATDLLQIFSETGVNIETRVGYAVVDNIVVSLSLNNESYTEEYDGDTYTASMSAYGVGVAYFFSGNWYGAAGVDMLTLSETDAEDINGLAFGVELGKYISFKENLYINPNIYLSSEAVDYGGSVVDTEAYGNMGIMIGFGARF